MESREVKFKKYREEIIAQNITKDEIKTTESTEETSYALKNTLTMSIDEIIEAHDEYTVVIQQKELDERIKQEKKERLIATIVKVSKYVCIALLLLLAIAIIVMIILLLWR